jgi:hypothetical protein
MNAMTSQIKRRAYSLGAFALVAAVSAMLAPPAAGADEAFTMTRVRSPRRSGKASGVRRRSAV